MINKIRQILKLSGFKSSRGMAQIPLMIGLLLMAIAIPAATKLVQQNQENQGRAAGCVASDCKANCIDQGFSGGTCTGSPVVCKCSSAPAPTTATHFCEWYGCASGVCEKRTGNFPTTISCNSLNSGGCKSVGAKCTSDIKPTVKPTATPTKKPTVKPTATIAPTLTPTPDPTCGTVGKPCCFMGIISGSPAYKCSDGWCNTSSICVATTPTPVRFKCVDGSCISDSNGSFTSVDMCRSNCKVLDAGESCEHSYECISGECTYSHCEKLLVGQDCAYGTQCDTGACQFVGEGKLCVDPTGNSGTLKKAGAECTSDPQCNSGKCTFNHCEKLLVGQDCTTGTQCSTGVCEAVGSRKLCVDPTGNSGTLKKAGAECTSDPQCNSGKCTFDHCEKLLLGQKCAVGGSCASGFCLNGTCTNTLTSTPVNNCKTGDRCVDPQGTAVPVCEGPTYGVVGDCEYSPRTVGYIFNGICCSNTVITVTPKATPTPTPITQCCCGFDRVANKDVCNWYKVNRCDSLAATMHSGTCTTPKPSDVPITTTTPTKPVATSTPRPDTCLKQGSNYSCVPYVCSTFSGLVSATGNCSNASSYCCKSTAVTVAPTRVSTITPTTKLSTPTPACISNSGKCNTSTDKCCNSGYYCKAAQYGYYCLNINDGCTQNSTKCVVESGISYEYTCDANKNWVPRTKRCDGGCNGNVCKVTCNSGEKKCEVAGGVEAVATCANDGAGWTRQSCSYGCDSVSLSCRPKPSDGCIASTRNSAGDLVPGKCNTSNDKCCTSGEVCTPAQYGYYCMKVTNPCTEGQVKCANGFETTCNNNGVWVPQTKRCDFGCNTTTNRCNTGCKPGERKCEDVVGIDGKITPSVAICTDDGTGWKRQSCTNGCNTTTKFCNAEPTPTILPTKIPIVTKPPVTVTNPPSVNPTKKPGTDPTNTPVVKPTKKPTVEPTGILKCTQCTNNSGAKLKGDADCDGETTINDYQIWIDEFKTGNYGAVTKNSWRADFDCSGVVDINDYQIWIDNFKKVN